MTCQLWWAQPADIGAKHRSLLNEVERQRAAAYRQHVDADRFTVGCVMSRLVLATALDMPAAQVPLRRDCGCGEPHGPPRTAPGWWLSVSHAGAWIVVAVTTLGGVGVDVERRDPASREAIFSVLTPSERRAVADVTESALPHALTRLWTRKEAAVKCTRRGLVDVAEVEVSAPFQPAAVLRYRAMDQPMRLHDIDVDAEHTAAVAIATAKTPAITQHDGTRLLRNWLATPCVDPHALLSPARPKSAHSVRSNRGDRPGTT